ncbi:hypothetical protein FN846DRAFT_960656 [Sphaerosporella brunnea]|uniref:Uncharacterized protein n=1 Tax=Sphaerosporella brunnea TaxID=1250544 RepID=A0A5J5EPC9_9PEZI|nr:hypothetical protein FN846DRAFT_960656 [Sphaerosporella brunnea]
MFRNGINIGRRPLGKLAHAKHELPFVCNSCQHARAMASWHRQPGTRAKKKDKKPGVSPKRKELSMLEQVKQLEAHVQMMERSYAEKLRKQAAQKTIPKEDVTEEEKDLAYAALMAPPQRDAIFLPKPEPTEVVQSLPPIVQERLGGLELVAVQKPRWDVVLTQLLDNGGLAEMTTPEVNKLITCMDLEHRAHLSSSVLDMMKEGGVKPNTLTYDLFMLAHAEVGNNSQVKTLFGEMTQKGLSPTVYSYGHLLKAYSQEKNLVAASDAFQQMQLAGIEPNLVVYTSLIQTCINCKEFNTAWEVFNLIKFKSTSTAPDLSAYTLMIHACALTDEAERALDLFEDLTVRRGMEPTMEIYNAVIHACAVRKDFFPDAWRLAVKMQQQGLPFDIRLLNVLVQACGRTGHLTRARVMVRHMMDSGKEALQPDLFTYQNLMRAYATYSPPAKKGARQRELLSEEKQVLTQEEASFMPTTTDPQLVRREKNSMLGFNDDKIPFLDKPILLNPREVVDEAALIINWLRETRPEFIDTHMMNSYLDVCIAHDAFEDMKFTYENDMENEVNPFQAEKKAAERAAQREAKGISEEEERLLAAMDLAKFKRNVYTYDIAMSGAIKNRKLKFARQVWQDRLAFTRTPAYWMIPAEERKEMDFLAERDLIDALALGGYLGEAMERIRVLRDEAGVRWTWEDLRTVYVKAVELEDPEVRDYVREVTGRVPKPQLPELHSR